MFNDLRELSVYALAKPKKGPIVTDEPLSWRCV